MNGNFAKSGNSGPKVRSDCEISLELREDGGIAIELKSKVGVLYGESIRRQCIEILSFYQIRDAVLRIDDSGALPFVISARLESAIKQLISTQLDYLPEMPDENKYSTLPDRFRFTRLYLPGNTPGLMINAGLHSADGIILDLEDSVAPGRKDEARLLVRNALRQLDFKGAERMVRINQRETGIRDLEAVVPQNVNMILIPKCEDAGTVRNIEARISEIRSAAGLENPVYLMPIIETALGVEMAFEIARSAASVVAMAVGLEDLTADMGVARTREGGETLYARTRIVNAAKAAGIQPIDSVFSDVGDMEGLLQNVLSSRALGFEGMGCIHPRQIPVIRKGYLPGAAEIERAGKIVMASEDALSRGLGVVSLGSKMIDPPVVARAQKLINLAVKLGLLPENWKDQMPSEQK